MTRILVVDDEESIRNLMKLTLELDGYQVSMAENGVAALEMFEKERPDVVLLDIRMPGMDGIEVLSRMKALSPDAEVIIISGHGDLDMAVECLRKQASNFLTKPVSEELLSLAIKRSLEKVALRKRLKKYTSDLEILVREANIELERAYQFRENIIENCPDALVCIRKGGEIIIFNSAAERLLGYNKEDVLRKKNIVDLYPPGLAKTIMKDLRSEDFGGRGILQKREIRFVDRSGQEIPVYISAAILYEDGKEAGSVGIFTDMREKISLEKQLLQSERLSSLGKLSAGVAREISEPLSVVLDRANDLISRFQEDPRTKDDIESIILEADRIKGIVQGILDIACESPAQKNSSGV